MMSTFIFPLQRIVKTHQLTAVPDLDARERMGKRHMTQAGDPVKGARAMYELAVMETPPLRVVIGSDAYASVMNKLEQYEQNYKRFESLSNSTDVDE